MRGLMLHLYEYAWSVDGDVRFSCWVIVTLFHNTSHSLLLLYLLLLCFLLLAFVVVLSFCGCPLNLWGNILY